MKKILAMILVLSMALTLVSVAAAEGKSPVDGMTVAFIPKVSGNSFFEAANDGAQKYAAEWGLTVDYIGSPDASVTTQLELIQQAIDKGVDAICISAVDATALDEKLMEAPGRRHLCQHLGLRRFPQRPRADGFPGHRGRAWTHAG